MMFETSAYYGQPTAMPLPFAPQSGFGTPSGQYGQPIWQQIGGPLAHPQLWGQLGGGGQLGNPLYQYGLLAGQAIGGWPGQPQFGGPFGSGGQFGNPLSQYGPLAGQAIGGWPGPPQLGGLFGHGGQFGNPLSQYGPLAGLSTGGWPQLGGPFAGFGGQFARPPLLEACPAMIVTPAFAPYGLVGNPLGGLAATIGSRSLGSSAVPFQATPQFAYGG